MDSHVSVNPPTAGVRQRYWRTTELVGGVTADELSRRTGRSIDAARSAARRQGIALAPKIRGYPLAIRNYVLSARARGEPTSRIANATGVSQRTIENWISQARRGTKL